MKMKFNVYLFRSEVQDFAQIFRPGAEKAYKEIEFVEEPPFQAKAYLRRNNKSTPPWVDFFRPHCRFPADIVNVSNSFILAIKQDERLFGLTYGQGYLALDRGRTDPTFGLTVAVHSILPDRIRCTESRNLKETATLKQLVLSRAAGLEQFEVDFDHEVLHRLEGVLKEETTLGSRIRGSAACGIVSEVDFDGLGDWCSDLLEVCGGKVPERLQRTLTLQPVRDTDLEAKLNDKLLDALLDGSSEAIHLSPSDIRSYNLVTRYALVKRGDNGQEVVVDLEDLDIDEVQEHLAGVDKESFEAIGLRIRGLNENGELVAEQPLLTTVVFETEHDGRLYVHQPYYWVEVSRDLVERLERRLADFVAPVEFELPRWDDAKKEGPYNDDVGANDEDLVSLDRKLVQVGGSKIEACDLLSNTGDFIHVKEYKSSQSITHLVAQAQVASDLLLEDKEFRSGLQEKIAGAVNGGAGNGGGWDQVVALDRVRPADHRIILAIGAKPDRKVPESLPYLSKQALFDTLIWLQRQGFPCFIYKIEKS